MTNQQDVSQAPLPKRRRWGLIIFLVLVGVLLVGGFLVMAGLASLMKGGVVSVKPDSTLVWKLDRQVREAPPNPIATQLFGAKVYQLLEIHTAIQRAAKDDRIKSLLIDVGGFSAGFAKIQQMRSDIEAFKKSGKPVYAYFESAGNGGYYLASAADKVYAPPTADLMITGLYSELPFYRGGLDKIMVEPQFYHIGDYKSYSDMFMRKDMSEAQKTAMNSILDSLYGQLVGGIASGRHLTEEQVKADIDTGMIFGKDILARGLVDGLWYRDQLEAALEKANSNKDGWNQIELSDYAKDRRFDFESGASKSIAVVIASGDIMSGEGDGSNGNLGSDTVVGWLQKAADNDKVKAVVLRVDSPGGSGLASDVIWREVELVRQKKPVVVSMSSTAASGGYFISMGADGIVAEPGTITGSIGVLTGKFVTKKLWDWTGVNYVPMKRGQNADLFSSYVPFSPDQEKLVVSMMQEFYKDFVTKAAQGRHKSYDEIDRIGQGRIWSGEEALKLGLVDQLGGLSEAIALAKSKARIGGSEKVRLEVYPRALTLMEAFFKGGLKDAREQMAMEDLPTAIRGPLRQLKAMEPLAAEPFLAYMPEKIEAK